MTFTLQGREVGPHELGLIRQLLQEHPDWSRWRLSKVLCQHWNWRNAAGQLKDMASRTLLLKLQDKDRAIQARVKDVYVYPLHRKFRERLSA